MFCIACAEATVWYMQYCTEYALCSICHIQEPKICYGNFWKIDYFST